MTAEVSIYDLPSIVTSLSTHLTTYQARKPARISESVLLVALQQEMHLGDVGHFGARALYLSYSEGRPGIIRAPISSKA